MWAADVLSRRDRKRAGVLWSWPARLPYGIASFFGPIIGTTIMGVAGIEGVYLGIGIVTAIFITAVIWRVTQIEAPKQKERPFVILTESMGQPIAHVAEEEIGGENLPAGGMIAETKE